MKGYKYVEIGTNKEVYDEDAESFVMDELGVTINPKGKYGEFTLEQLDFINEFTEWFFSANWVKEKIKEDDGNIFKLIKEESELENGF